MTDKEYGRRITISVKDRHGELVPGTKVEWYAGDKLLGKVISSSGHANFQPKDPKSVITVKVTRKRITEQITLDSGQNEWHFILPMTLHPTWSQFIRKHFAGVVGIVFVLFATTLVFIFSTATKVQIHVALALFALGGGGFSGEFARFIKVDLKIGTQVGISAFGAAAIFVILFFFVPAGSG